MSESREFYAATVEEALEKAAAGLGVSRDELRFQVLDEGSTGFLGIGARDARVFVEVPESRSMSSTMENEQLTSETTGVVEQHQLVPDIEHAEIEAGLIQEAGESTEDIPEDLIVAVDEFVTTLMNAMGFQATVDAYESGEVITVDVITKETGLLVGRKGETIDAVQYLTNVAVYRDRVFSKKIVIDSEGYRQRRVEALQGMAHRTARRAVREEQALSLPPMTAAERRVVHLFLEKNPHVDTSSEGEEEDRRVVITPI
ncbi:MAG: RNA-binding protein Jag [uncultured Rubrobacteraceae bacterium]|uniref:RNA-binding protein KhpB n=1 Tax=uncultured Rubrobacteraceae bacterium TaxID=349277 RepID=A0A6J4R4U3_9ACTN|nr:MAG: RNA-binding protein Jag [uncultured Rubrobacteraceae bacterium]